MGIEGFSKPFWMHDMNPILGGKREFIWLFGFMLVIPMLAAGRKANEDGVVSLIKTTNRYEKMHLDQ